MFAAQRISYQQTNAFTKIVLEYLHGSDQLQPFYAEAPTLEGIKATLRKKQAQPVDRIKLVETLQQQYQSLEASGAVRSNIEKLLSEKTFTITTAHQPNLFTGPLYFIYKILHAIKLAEYLGTQLPEYHFVPVYYMGSEDADFAELNHTFVDGKKLEWKKEQKGAVGRMVVDKTLVRLIDELEGQLLQEPQGPEVINLLRRSYSLGKTIQQATFEVVNALYGSYGLVVLIPDRPELKAQLQKVFADDLFHHTPAQIVQQTSGRLEKHFSVQAHPREINLFYLKDDIRERIIRKDDAFIVHNTSIRFTQEEMQLELETHPERFSPNVILRGLYQESILPNLVFIGGGGELAYWLQLKDLFDHYQVVYPVLVLRNSFLVVTEKWKTKIEKLGFSLPEFFQPQEALMNQIVARYASQPVSLNGNFEKAETLFDQIKVQAGAIDATLVQHVAALQKRSLKNLQELEKKMLRAEKRKFSDQERQIAVIKSALFPGEGLQERKENFTAFYAKWGKAFIEALYENSPTLEQEFVILDHSG
ncbi:MAG: bacillithiol biosynthesis cysteine-adding enzyme BshC [Flavisolibacter sp.]